MEIPPNRITKAIIAIRPIDHNIDEIRSKQSMVTEKMSAQKLKHNASTGFQPQTQTTSGIINPNINNTETTESSSLTEVTGISFLTNSTLITGITIPLKVPTKTVRSNSDIHIDPKTYDKLTAQDNFFSATSLEFQFQNNETVPFSQFNLTRRNTPMYNQFTGFTN